ncbi:MAG: phosphorylase [Burkholderiaceae bacterium]
MKPSDSRGIYVVAVTGLAVEARIAAGSAVVTVVGGGNTAVLEAALAKHLTADVRGIVSFGLCGGLKRGLRPGSCIIGREVVTATERWGTDRAWSDAIAACLPHAKRGDIAAVDAPVCTTADKARLAATTDAIAIDTESHIAAKLATQRRLPFVVLRVIADPADRALPPAAKVALRADGRIDVLAVMRSVIAAPAQLPLLIRLARDTRMALSALAQSRRRLGTAMGYPNLGELRLDVP